MDIAEADVRRQIGLMLPELRGFARFLARDPVLADDLVQDCIVRALASLHQFEPGTSLKAWLFTILRNAFYEGLRRCKREAAALVTNDFEQSAALTNQDARLDLDDLQRLIWQLPPLLREALILVGAQEMSHDEAAAVCNVPVGTMKARLSRARSALAKAAQPTEQAILTRP